METEHIGHSIDGAEPITDPTTYRDHSGVESRDERNEHDGTDHCGVGTEGRAIVDIRNEDGEHFLLIHDGAGVAIMPNETVDPGEDWAAVAREAAAGYTGIEIEIDAILSVGTVEHIVPGQDDPQMTTTRAVFRGSPVGGGIDECKRTAANGSDEWRVEWCSQLSDGVSAPEGGPERDLALVLG
jgi:hypothetical protein